MAEKAPETASSAAPIKSDGDASGAGASPATKAIIKNVDMSEEMQQASVDIASEALNKFSVEKDIAAHVKRTMDSRFGPTWHAVVGKNYGSYVTHGEFLKIVRGYAGSDCARRRSARRSFGSSPAFSCTGSSREITAALSRLPSLDESLNRCRSVVSNRNGQRVCGSQFELSGLSAGTLGSPSSRTPYPDASSTPRSGWDTDGLCEGSAGKT